LPATINAGGGFSANFNTATVDVTGNPYPVGFSYAAGQDVNFTAATGSTQLTIVDQTAPVTSNVVANPNPVPQGTPTTLSGTVSDAGTGSSTIKQFEYSTNGGTTWTPMALPGTAITQPVSIALNLQTGVYSLCLRGTDFAGNTSAPQCTLAAVYDASAGFVTGGGWITSQPGWCRLSSCSSSAVQANFGFNSRYKSGTTTPTGQTAFQLAGLDLESTSYQWMTISGNRMQFQGTGTVNGTGAYNFMVTAIDGDMGGPQNGTDYVRVKIWDPSTGAVIYDSQPGAPNASNPTTPLGGGNVMIHAS
jgi:hypothetical protein